MRTVMLNTCLFNKELLPLYSMFQRETPNRGVDAVGSFVPCTNEPTTPTEKSK